MKFKYFYNNKDVLACISMFGFRGAGFDFQVIYVMIMADRSLAHRFNILMGNGAVCYLEATDNCRPW